MGYFITPTSSYYEGDRAHQLDVEVPQRPSFTYDWDGAQWVLNPAKVPVPRKTRAEREAEIDAIPNTIASIKLYLKDQLPKD
jgi:hypothetical protein